MVHLLEVVKLFSILYADYVFLCLIATVEESVMLKCILFSFTAILYVDSKSK